MAEDDVLRRLGRIEGKLDNRVVYKDTYEAERAALREGIASVAELASQQIAAGAAVQNEKIGNIEDDVTDLNKWRTTVYALIATSYVALLGGLILYLIQSINQPPIP